jgi:ribosomal protein S27AE
MAKTCPRCGEAIDHLITKYLQIWRHDDHGRRTLIQEELAWSCPKCGAVLFEGFPDSEAEATKWLAQS